MSKTGNSPGRNDRNKVDPARHRRQDAKPGDANEAADRNLDAAYQGKEHGEGNYKAAKQYGESVRGFVRSGQVDRAARQAKPASAGEAHDLEAAEQSGRSRSKGEDPALKRK